MVAAELSLLHLLQAVVLPENAASLLCLKLGYLNLPLPVLVLARLLNAVVFLHHKCQRLRHVLLVLHQRLQRSLTLVVLPNSLFRGLDVSLLLLETGQLGGLVFFELCCLELRVGQVLLKTSQHLGGGAAAELELDQLFVPLLDFLHVLLVRDLHLMEIDELKVVTHLLLLLDLRFGLEDCHFEGHILLSKFLDLSLFL